MPNIDNHTDRPVYFYCPFNAKIGNHDVSVWPTAPSEDCECVIVPGHLLGKLADIIQGDLSTPVFLEKFGFVFGVSYEEDSIFDLVVLKEFSAQCFQTASKLDILKTGEIKDRANDLIVALLYNISAMCDRSVARNCGLIIYT